MINSWSHQLLINYILTIYVLYTKIGVLKGQKMYVAEAHFRTQHAENNSTTKPKRE